MYKLSRILTAYIMLIASISLPYEGRAQAFDPFAGEGAEFTVYNMAMIWMGASQSIVEACDGDVAPIGKKIVEVSDAASQRYGRDFSNILVGMFGEAMAMTDGLVCDVDKFRLYSGWADLYYEAAISRLR